MIDLKQRLQSQRCPIRQFVRAAGAAAGPTVGPRLCGVAQDQIRFVVPAEVTHHAAVVSSVVVSALKDREAMHIVSTLELNKMGSCCVRRRFEDKPSADGQRGENPLQAFREVVPTAAADICTPSSWPVRTDKSEQAPRRLVTGTGPGPYAGTEPTDVHREAIAHNRHNRIAQCLVACRRIGVLPL